MPDPKSQPDPRTDSYARGGGESVHAASYDRRMDGRSADIAVTVDLVAFTTRAAGLSVVLIQRKNPPYRGNWALPGGFLEVDEDLAEGASREMSEETGLQVPPSRLTQVGAYGSPGRDPRMRTVSTVFTVLDDDLGSPLAGDDAASVQVWPVREVLADPELLAFDHHQIMLDALAVLGLEDRLD